MCIKKILFQIVMSQKQEIHFIPYNTILFIQVNQFSTLERLLLYLERLP